MESEREINMGARAKKNELIVIILLLPQQRITLCGSVFMVTFDAVGKDGVSAKCVFYSAGTAHTYNSADILISLKKISKVFARKLIMHNEGVDSIILCEKPLKCVFGT